MSYDLVIWRGAPSAATQRWASIEAGDEDALPLPDVELLAAMRETFASELRVVPEEAGHAVQGRGWEVFIAPGTHAIVECRWERAGEPAMVAGLVRAAHAAGCSVYDPQHGAYWPVSAGTVGDAPWHHAFFDEGWVYDDEDDEIGHLGGERVRLCPNEITPDAKQVWLEIPSVLARAAPADARRRVTVYGRRFPGSKVLVVFTGPKSSAPSVAEGRDILRKEGALAVLHEQVGVESFHVLGLFDPLAAMARIDPCPFEVVAKGPEEISLASIFGELPVRWIVVVPTHVLEHAPDAVRAGLRSIHAAAAIAGAVHYANPLAASDAPVGANVAWVEALLDLPASEAPVEVEPATVPLAPEPDP